MRLLRRLPLLAEALLALTIASLAIAFLSFRRVAALSTRRPARTPATPTQARAVAAAIDAWGDRVPWRAVCFQRGLAAQLMLRRRGLAAELYYGAARDDAGKLAAHVWVRSGETDVIGCEEVARYGLLAVFPAP